MTAASAQWRARPAAGRAVQLVVLAVPIAASVGCAALVSNSLPHARDLGAALGWWAIVLVCSTLTLYAVDRIARRLLPLALLLRLSLVFPDQAPKRFRVAARSWSTRRLREQSGGDTTQILGLLANLAAHDRRTRGHCERVRAYNDLLAEELGLPEQDRDRLRWAALIHDIGKLAVPRRVLNKPGQPTPREWEELHAHPDRGAEIAAPLADWLGPWALAISQHHEHWDGTGYPNGLSGTDISLGARIVGVADAFEVMTSPRPYKKPMSTAAAREELAAYAGKQFDPQVVRALLNISIGRLRKSMGPIAWFAQVPLLASMPRLSAALIQSAQSAAVGAGGAIGVVAISASPAAATHHVHHQAAPHPRPTAASQSLAATSPLTGPLLAVTGQPSVATPLPTAAAPTPAARHPHGKSHARKPAAASIHRRATGRQTAVTKRHHGAIEHASRHPTKQLTTHVNKHVSKHVTRHVARHMTGHLAKHLRNRR